MVQKIDLRYYDHAEGAWIAPLASGQELAALQQTVNTLGQTVNQAVTSVTQAVGAVEALEQHMENHINLVLTNARIPVEDRTPNTYYMFIQETIN